MALAVGLALVGVLPHHVSVHDALWAWAMAALGGWLGGAPGRRVAALALFLVVGDLGAGQAGFRPRADVAEVAAGPSTWAYRCLLDVALTHPDDRPDRPRPRVVHLGDSMIAGNRDRSHTLVAALDAQDAARSHLRVAVPGVGPDCALRLLRRLPPVDAVVLHIFPANDATDLFSAYGWCDEGPLLEATSPGLPDRCADGPHDLPLWRRARWDPAPWALRAAARRSALAHGVWEGALGALHRRLGARPVAPPSEGRWARADLVLAALVAEAARREVPLKATLLPWSGLRPTPPLRAELVAETEGWRAALARHGIDMLDLTDALADVTDPQVPGVYVSDSPPDGHLGPEGARRLAARVGAWLAGWPDAP